MFLLAAVTVGCLFFFPPSSSSSSSSSFIIYLFIIIIIIYYFYGTERFSLGLVEQSIRAVACNE
jgi:hypothetical protein